MQPVCLSLENEIATFCVAHLHFLKRTKPNKKCKRATNPTHGQKDNAAKMEEN